jgi:hypothetical protein
MEQCKKTKYSTEEAALLDIARIKRISNRDKIPQKAYFCTICSSWHLSSKKSSQSKLLGKVKEYKDKLKVANETIINLKKELKKKDVESIQCELEILRKANKRLAKEILELQK